MFSSIREHNYGGGLTPLVDAEGKPLLYREMPHAPEYWYLGSVHVPSTHKTDI